MYFLQLSTFLFCSLSKERFNEWQKASRVTNHQFPFPFKVKAGKQQGFEIKADSNKLLADSLDLAVDSKNPYFNTMLRMIATRCMMQVRTLYLVMLVPTNYIKQHER